MEHAKKPLIHILSPQLANQIAAGEVVERPSSVVKELIENSLDAGATQIRIDIEKGGSQLIRIRDNGCGIGKQDLILALTRHATSKISSLEDLEMILSLGFRGEALASISSVSRLTLTSRPEYQSEAWQAYAQGREMEIEIKPASHPVGTTIEVANLFFNTPARRKFLRSDKTEFAHIDEIVRRIALAKPTVTFILTHNEKIIRHYRAVADNSTEQQQKRIATICGTEFIDNSVHIDWQHDDLHLYGWIGLPVIARNQNDLSYSYVNGRVMRDKTINHAIRQAFGEKVGKESYPAYVLFLDLNPSFVDVNVHPAKHEVRFHQGRLVHDFIYQGVLNALEEQSQMLPKDTLNEPFVNYQPQKNRLASGQNIFHNMENTKSIRQSYSFRQQENPNLSHFIGEKINKTEPKLYQELISPISQQQTQPEIIIPEQTARAQSIQKENYLHALAIVKNQALLCKFGEEFSLINLEKLSRLKLQHQLTQKISQGLLIPLNLVLNKQQYETWKKLEGIFQKIGFHIQEKQWQEQTRLTILQVPICLREQNLQKLIYAALNEQAVNLIEFFAKFVEIHKVSTLTESIALLAEIEKIPDYQTLLNNIKTVIDFTDYLLNE